MFKGGLVAVSFLRGQSDRRISATEHGILRYAQNDKREYAAAQRIRKII